jgi:amino acid transporter
MVWGWTFCSIFLTTIGLAMGELASAAPTSGGLYYWTFMFSTPKWRCFLAWIVGCKLSNSMLSHYSSFLYQMKDSNTISNVASVASVDWGCAVQIMAAVSIGSNLSFQATTVQTL